MKPGSLVKWIGFPGATKEPEEMYGIVLSMTIFNKAAYNEDRRLTILWSNGKIGKSLYPETIEVINESR